MGEPGPGQLRRPLLHHHHHHPEEAESVGRAEEGEDAGSRQLENGQLGNRNQDVETGKEGGQAIDKELENRLEHAITILGEPPVLARQMPIDPFKNQTREIDGVYDCVKTVLFLPVLVLRVLMVIAVLFVGLITTKLALAGYEQEDAPFPRWRRHIMFGTRFCGRAIMFCFGIHWIRQIGHPAPREVAPIVVSNHVSFIDPIFYFWELLPIFVSSTSHDDLFLVGSIIRAMQVITVDRCSPASRRSAADEIKKKASNDDYPRVVLFPEGTTTNGRALISYKLGAFRPGLAVQPVVGRYFYLETSLPNAHSSHKSHGGRTGTFSRAQVEYLPVVYPSKKDVDNAEAFTSRVRYIMATALNVPETEHTYGDLMLAVKSSEMKRYPAAEMMVEMGRMEKLFHLTTIEVKEYLDKFIKMDCNHRFRTGLVQIIVSDPTQKSVLARHLTGNPRFWMEETGRCDEKSHVTLKRGRRGANFCIDQIKQGYVTMDQFLEALDLPKCPFSEKIFLMFDISEQGYINFKEFVAALGFLSNHTEFADLVKSSFQGCGARNDGVFTQLELESRLRSVFPTISEIQVEQMFEKLDVNRDGVISWEEFRKFLEKNPELLAVFVAATCAV